MSVRSLACYFLLFFLLFFNVPANSSTETDSQHNLDSVQKSLKTTLAYKAELETKLKEVSNSKELSDLLNQALNLVEKTELVYGQQLELIKFFNSTQETQKTKLQHLSDVHKNKTYSIPLLDQYQTSLSQELALKNKVTKEQDLLHSTIGNLKDEYATNEKNRRLMKEKFGDSKNDIDQMNLLIAELESQLAQEKLILQNLKQKKLAYTLEDIEKNIIGLSKTIAFISANINFTEANLKEILKDISKQQDQVAKKIEQEKTGIENLKITLNKLAEKDSSYKIALKKIEKTISQAKLDFYTHQLDSLINQKKMWTWRHGIFNNQFQRNNLKSWLNDLEAAIADNASKKQTLLDTISAFQRKIISLEEQLNTESDEVKANSHWIKSQIKAIKEFSFFSNDAFLEIEDNYQFYQKIKTIIEEHTSQISFNDIALASWDYLVFFWDYEITSIDDRPLTLGKLSVGLLLFILGLFSSRFLSRILRNRLYERIISNDQGRSAFQSITHYVLVIIFSLFALKAANIPLTIFTLLGGAIAIGLGFGSQNLINNFISGLILLAEKPINVGDMIEVDGTYGRVLRVGARCTNVRTFTNIDILVPNSALLEKNVINWTLSDDLVRTQISVGVAYGSPVETVMSLITQATRDNKDILKIPEPIVIFSDFGDSALLFEAHFWIRMKTVMDRRVILSNLRVQINQLFRDNNITIPFPQRDLHMNTLKPLDVVIRQSS